MVEKYKKEEIHVSGHKRWDPRAGRHVKVSPYIRRQKKRVKEYKDITKLQQKEEDFESDPYKKKIIKKSKKSFKENLEKTGRGYKAFHGTERKKELFQYIKKHNSVPEGEWEDAFFVGAENFPTHSYGKEINVIVDKSLLDNVRYDDEAGFDLDTPSHEISAWRINNTDEIKAEILDEYSIKLTKKRNEDLKAFNKNKSV